MEKLPNLGHLQAVQRFYVNVRDALGDLSLRCRLVGLLLVFRELQIHVGLGRGRGGGWAIGLTAQGGVWVRILYEVEVL